MSEIITIRSCASREEAELLKSLLEASGIQAMIAEDNYIGLPLMVSGGVKLQVLGEQADQAGQILDAAEEDVVFEDEAEFEAEAEDDDESEI